MGTTQRKRRSSIVAALIAMLGLVAFVVGVTSAVSTAGNDKGSIKITEGEKGTPANDPHLGTCGFTVQLFGFPEGNGYQGTVSAEGQAPTGDGVVLIDDDPITFGSNGGSGNTLDFEKSYDLTNALQAIQPHPVQGWHVKVSVKVNGENGADDFKVFWVTGCVPEETTTTVTTAVSPTTVTTAAVEGVVETTTPTAQPTVQPSQLAFTGAGERMLWLAVAGMGLMLMGAGLYLSQRPDLALRRSGR